MPISEKLEHAGLAELYLDPKNPRLGRHDIEAKLSQKAILERMQDWALSELAVSFLESGFWTQEPLVVVEEPLLGRKRLIVVEGNRRLAALKLLDQARKGDAITPAWQAIARSGTAKQFHRIEQIPFVRASTRSDVHAYLGFRHVSGIKEWKPAEKAQFIAYLIEETGLDYGQVTRRIGSKLPTVRQHYIAYRILLQMENLDEDIALEKVEERFSVLYLSLRTNGVQQYLHINIKAEPSAAKRPIPKKHLDNLVAFARWLFGTEKRPPLVADSRQVDRFGLILESSEARSYLERTNDPVFETASRIAGGDEVETAAHVERAADALELALSTAHHHQTSERLKSATRRVAQDVARLLELFPDVKAALSEERQ